MKIGLFFGTFNPIHIGHLIIAQAALSQAKLDKIWFVVSPSSPDKDYSKLLHEFDRFDLVREAIRNNPDFKVLDVEFHLLKPSYTYHTLRKLRADFPENEFFIILGSDNFENLNRWKNAEEIRQQVKFVVYPRPGKPIENRDDELVKIIKAPLLQISASEIRDMVSKGQSIHYLIPEDARILMEKKGFYKDFKPSS
jgi:nicotinate-nucleotide adenylyltransferase